MTIAFSEQEDSEGERIDRVFGADQPIVEFSEEKINSMFDFNLPPSNKSNIPRAQYTSLERGEARPLFSRVTSSLNRIFQQR